MGLYERIRDIIYDNQEVGNVIDNDSCFQAIKQIISDYEEENQSVDLAIDVFSSYEVKQYGRYSYISDKIGNEYFFSDDNIDQTKVINGGLLMEWIANELKDSQVIYVKLVAKNKLYIEDFNPNTGEGSDMYIEWNRVEEKKYE